MINVSRAPLPIRSIVIDFTSHHTGRSLAPMHRWITSKIIFFFQFKIQILTHESNFHVIWFLDGFNICDAVGRVSLSRINFDATVTASNWILAAFRPEF
jgi:hypothetical protein